MDKYNQTVTSQKSMYYRKSVSILLNVYVLELLQKKLNYIYYLKIHVFSFCGRDPIYFISHSLQKLDMQVNKLAFLGRF